jgi:EpsI family protein
MLISQNAGFQCCHRILSRRDAFCLFFPNGDGISKASVAPAILSARFATMKINPVQAILASIAILATAVLAQVLTPRELMASASSSLDLEKVIPRQFGQWTYTPNVGLVTPSEPEGFVETDRTATKIYSRELGRGYSDREGHVVMLLVAYGPVQNYRLKSHRPEVCYTAAGFRISSKSTAAVSYRDGVAPVQLERLITERESRFEPVSYWRRVGNDISNGIFENQIARLKYGLHGLIPDGALVRVSIIGLPAEQSFKLQDQFIRDLLNAVDPQTQKFLVGQTS